MQPCPRGIRKHIQDIVFWFGAVIIGTIGLVLGPIFLPFNFNSLKVVGHTQFFIAQKYGTAPERKSLKALKVIRTALFLIFTFKFTPLQKSAEDRFQKRRLRNTYFSIVVSIALVLFLVGILGVLLINSKKVADHFKEQIALSLYVNDTAKKIEVQQLIKTLQLNPATKKVVWVTKEEAAEIYTNEIGEDFMEFLGYNPLLASVDVYFNASYATPIFVKNLSESLDYNFVNEITYDKPLLELLDTNIQKISYWFLFTALLFVIVAMLLINSSIRLSIHSKRFIIKTMQLVGAHKRFIRRPFIRTHVQLGAIASLLASAGVTAVVWELNKRFPELQILRRPEEPALILGIVVLLGVSITYFSTYFATQRYLNLNTNAIY